MRVLYAILILSAFLPLLAFTDTNAPPMPPVGTNKTIGEPYTITADGQTNAVQSYPFLLATGVDTNGKVIMEAPPDWMLTKKQPEPYYEIRAWDDLTDKPIIIRVYSQKEQGFFASELKRGEQ